MTISITETAYWKGVERDLLLVRYIGPAPISPSMVETCQSHLIGMSLNDLIWYKSPPLMPPDMSTSC